MLVLSKLDTMTIAMNDLFRFVNEQWLETHTIPDDRPIDGTFYQLRDQAEADVHEIVKNTPASRAGKLFRSYMDTEGIDAVGISAIDADVQLIDEAQLIDDFITNLGTLSRTGIGAPVGIFVAKDSGSEDAIPYVFQAGLGLPDEAYYREEAHKQVLAAYEEHVGKMLAFVGLGADEAARIVALEKEIAAGHWDVVATRDAVKTYNPTVVSELPGAVQALVAPMLPGIDNVVNMMPSYLEHLSGLLVEERLADWKLWATWHVLQSRASVLTDEINKANFAFYGTVLTGTPTQRDRWKRALGLAESFMGDEIGQLFVAEHFPESSKEEMLKLVDYLVKAYRERISNLEWMTPATQKRALEKLEKFQAKIGYPDTWRDYGDLDFDASGSNLVENVRKGAAFTHDYELNKVAKPYDRTEWFSTPQTVNAFYNPTVNDITFPAAILRPPFYSPDADAAENFGAIGAVIGHEIGHGFDDQGSHYDGDGNLNSWWTEEDREAFNQRTAKLVEQFQGLVPQVVQEAGLETTGVNGEFTLGENIGDLGGLGITIVAYRMYLADQGLDFESTEVAPFPTEGGSDELGEHEYNGLQRLFLAWSHVWRTKQRPEMAVQLLAADPHSPAEFRCNVIAGNIAEFYEAFDVNADAPVFIPEEDRVTIW